MTKRIKDKDYIMKLENMKKQASLSNQFRVVAKLDFRINEFYKKKRNSKNGNK